MELPGLLDTHESNLLPKDGVVEYYHPFFREDLTNQLIHGIDWQQDEIQMFGKIHPLPRLTAWYGDPNASYTYSGITNSPRPWIPILQKIKDAVEQQCNTQFNSVLLNYYRDGNDHMSWHTDDEKELGQNPTIASVSFGEKRRFQFKHKTDKGIEVITVEPDSGSLLIMRGDTQENWNHRLVKTAKPVNSRINLTFRTIIC